MTFGSTQPLT